MPHRMPVFISLILTSIGSALLIGSVLTLWDIGRSNSLGNENYWLPFMVASTPWYIAADVFVALALLGAGFITVGLLFVRVIR